MDYTTLKPRIGKLKPSRLQITPVRNVRIKGATSAAIRERILIRDSGICRCAECIQSGALKPAHQVDHVIPLWAGGSESDANRSAINVECHKRKSAAEARMRAQGGFDPTYWAAPALSRDRPL